MLGYDTNSWFYPRPGDGDQRPVRVHPGRSRRDPRDPLGHVVAVRARATAALPRGRDEVEPARSAKASSRRSTSWSRTRTRARRSSRRSPWTRSVSRRRCRWTTSASWRFPSSRPTRCATSGARRVPNPGPGDTTTVTRLRLRTSDRTCQSDVLTVRPTIAPPDMTAEEPAASDGDGSGRSQRGGSATRDAAPAALNVPARPRPGARGGCPRRPTCAWTSTTSAGGALRNLAAHDARGRDRAAVGRPRRRRRQQPRGRSSRVS